MLADIAHGHVDGADVLFLVAAILFVVAFLLTAMSTPKPIDRLLAFAGLACVALGWLIL